MKKEWTDPIILELSIKETTCGSKKPLFHDGMIYESTDQNGNIVAVEEYFFDS